MQQGVEEQLDGRTSKPKGKRANRRILLKLGGIDPVAFQQLAEPSSIVSNVTSERDGGTSLQNEVESGRRSGWVSAEV